MKSSKCDMAKSLAKIIDSTFVKVDGILIEKGINKQVEDGFMWSGQWYATIDEVRDEMKGLSSVINLSIVNPNGEVTRLGREYTDKLYKGQSAYTSFKNEDKCQKKSL